MAPTMSLAHDAGLPIFKVEHVQLQFNIASDFVGAQASNNVLILALASGRILRIDLDNPGDIDGKVMAAQRSQIIRLMITQISIFPRNLLRPA